MTRRLAFVLILCGGLCGFSRTVCVAQTAAAAPADAKAEAAGEGERSAALKEEDEYYELLKVFVDTLDQVERNYVDKVDRRELMESAIRGVLAKLDPYSNYISPGELTKFRDNVDSKFGGIGIQIGMEGGQLKIISPIVGSPAYREGVEAGDHIIEIGGKTTEDITLDEAVQRLKGEPNTSVTIKIRRPDDGKVREINLTREEVRVDTVMGDQRKDDDSWDYLIDHKHKIGYIRLSAFSRDTPHELEEAMQELEQEGMKGLILDLRFDPGGLLTAAIEIADMFISEGKIVSTRGRNTEERVWEAHKAGTYEGFPMVVLVNRYSASASEILSACLQDHKRAVIIGERSWGKGSVQNVIELEGGRSALKLTTASYWRPSGKNIHRTPGAKEWGVDPNEGFEVKVDGDELRKLVSYRRDRDILKRHELPKEKPEDKKPDGEVKKPKADEAEAAKPEDKPSDKAADKPASKDASDDKEEAKAEKPDNEGSPFVDRQLQKALDYIKEQLAKEGK